MCKSAAPNPGAALFLERPEFFVNFAYGNGCPAVQRHDSRRA